MEKKKPLASLRATLFAGRARKRKGTQGGESVRGDKGKERRGKGNPKRLRISSRRENREKKGKVIKVLTRILTALREGREGNIDR